MYPGIASERHQNVVTAIPRQRNWGFEADAGINDSVSEAPVMRYHVHHFMNLSHVCAGCAP